MSRWQFETDRRRQLRLIERILEINAGRRQVLDDWHSHQHANCSPVDDWRKHLIDITSFAWDWLEHVQAAIQGRQETAIVLDQVQS